MISQLANAIVTFLFNIVMMRLAGRTGRRCHHDFTVRTVPVQCLLSWIFHQYRPDRSVSSTAPATKKN